MQNKDHDYLGNLAGQSSARRTQNRRSTNDETTKIYEETVNVLHSINNNISREADILENLVSEFKTCSATIKEALENLNPNLI